MLTPELEQPSLNIHDILASINPDSDAATILSACMMLKDCTNAERFAMGLSEDIFQNLLIHIVVIPPEFRQKINNGDLTLNTQNLNRQCQSVLEHISAARSILVRFAKEQKSQVRTEVADTTAATSRYVSNTISPQEKANAVLMLIRLISKLPKTPDISELVGFYKDIRATETDKIILFNCDPKHKQLSDVIGRITLTDTEILNSIHNRKITETDLKKTHPEVYYRLEALKSTILELTLMPS